MATKDEVCKQCGILDRYVKGDFSYCRPCHTEAQKRYMQNKAQGISKESLKAPAHSLSFVVSGSHNLPVFCKNGHPMYGDNVVTSSQRNGRHLRRRCKTCERNAKRVKYGLAPELASPRLTELLDND